MSNKPSEAATGSTSRVKEGITVTRNDASGISIVFEPSHSAPSRVLVEAWRPQSGSKSDAPATQE